MKRTASQRIADALVILCGLLIFCDLLLLVLSPALAYFRFQDPASMLFDHLLAVSPTTLTTVWEICWKLF